MYDTTSDLIGHQTSFRRKFCPTYNFKIMDFFFDTQSYGTLDYEVIYYVIISKKWLF